MTSESYSPPLPPILSRTKPRNLIKSAEAKQKRNTSGASRKAEVGSMKTISHLRTVVVTIITPDKTGDTDNPAKIR